MREHCSPLLAPVGCTQGLSQSRCPVNRSVSEGAPSPVSQWEAAGAASSRVRTQTPVPRPGSGPYTPTPGQNRTWLRPGSRPRPARRHLPLGGREGRGRGAAPRGRRRPPEPRLPRGSPREVRSAQWRVARPTLSSARRPAASPASPGRSAFPGSGSRAGMSSRQPAGRGELLPGRRRGCVHTSDQCAPAPLRLPSAQRSASARRAPCRPAAAHRVLGSCRGGSLHPFLGGWVT